MKEIAFNNATTLKVNNLTVNLHQQKIIEDISFTLRKNSITTIIGPNGAGKSTLIKAIAGDIDTQNGSIEFNGNRMDPRSSSTERARAIAVLPQLSLLNFPYTCLEVVLLGRIPHSTGTIIDQEIAQECLKKVDMVAFASRTYPELSGGEKQRIQIARVLAQIWRQEDSQQSRLLILDEPISALDLGHQQILMEVLREFTQQNTTILMVLHDLNTAIAYSDDLIAMLDGKLILSGQVENVLSPAIVDQLFGIDCQIITHPTSGKPVVLNNHNNLMASKSSANT